MRFSYFFIKTTKNYDTSTEKTVLIYFQVLICIRWTGFVLFYYCFKWMMIMTMMKNFTSPNFEWHLEYFFKSLFEIIINADTDNGHRVFTSIKVDCRLASEHYWSGLRQFKCLFSISATSRLSSRPYVALVDSVSVVPHFVSCLVSGMRKLRRFSGGTRCGFYKI